MYLVDCVVLLVIVLASYPEEQFPDTGLWFDGWVGEERSEISAVQPGVAVAVEGVAVDHPGGNVRSRRMLEVSRHAVWRLGDGGV